MLRLERYEEAEAVHRALIDENPESLQSIKGFITSKLLGAPICADNQQQVLEILGDIIKKYPRCHASSLLSLEYAEGDLFHKLLEGYLIKCFRKGISSLFKSLLSILQNPVKRGIILDKVTEYQSNLSNCGMFKPDDSCIIILTSSQRISDGLYLGNIFFGSDI